MDHVTEAHFGHCFPPEIMKMFLFFFCVAGEKPYKCHQCGHTFVSSGVLKSHLKTHTGLKEHKCHICHALFTTNGSLTRHMTIHSNVKPFKCPHCTETFRTAFHCKKHMRLHRFAGTCRRQRIRNEENTQACKKLLYFVTETVAPLSTLQRPPKMDGICCSQLECSHSWHARSNDWQAIASCVNFALHCLLM